MTPAAVVTFHPDGGWPDRLDALSREHSRIVVVDNSTSSIARGFVTATAASHPGIDVYTLPTNLGIGAALNLAFTKLAAEGHSRAVAYDQDSTPGPQFVESLIATAVARPCVAVVGAVWTDPQRPNQPARFLRAAGPGGIAFRRIPAEQDLYGLISVIMSGSLFDLSIWRTLNGFDPGLFLDYVDTDYCLRARRAGYEIAAAAAATLLHHRGDKQPVRLLGQTFFPAHTPPFRLRSLTRNRLLLFRRHGLRPFAWTMYECAYGAKLLADALLFEDRKASRVAAMLRGLGDGLLHRDGPVRST